MTTQAINLPGRVPPGPMRIQRADKSCYVEADHFAVERMIKARIVEGVGPRSGRIDVLRIICTEEEAIERLRAMDEAPKEMPGAVTSQASREVFRERLSNTLWTFCHKANRRLTLSSELI